MARWPTLAISLVAVAVLITSTAAPALLESVHPQGVPGGPSADNVPTLELPPPSAQAFGLYVSGASEASPPLFGPSPFAEVQSDWGRSEELVQAAEVQVKSTDGLQTLAHVKGIKGQVATRDDATFNTDLNKWQHWSTQARGHMYVGWASLMNGAVKAGVLHSHVFTSANVRNPSADFRLTADDSRVVDLEVLGVKVKVDNTLVLPIVGVGTLYVNETLKDPVAGTLTNYALRLHLNNGMDIIVAGSTAKVTRHAATDLMNCLTWSEAYPVGDKSRVVQQLADVKHNQVMGDATQQGTARGRIDDVPAESMNAILTADAMLATHETDVDIDFATSRTLGEVTYLSLLGGTITADLVRGEAKVSIAIGSDGAYGLETDATGSKLLNLRILNQPLEASVLNTPNTEHQVVLNGKVVARVLLNEQTVAETNTDGILLASLRVNALRILVTGHELGVPVGTQIVVGHAISIATCDLDGGMPPMPPMDFGDPLGLRPA